MRTLLFLLAIACLILAACSGEGAPIEQAEVSPSPTSVPPDTPTPEPTATPEPTNTPTATPSPTNTPQPSATPTPTPTSEPTVDEGKKMELSQAAAAHYFAGEFEEALLVYGEVLELDPSDAEIYLLRSDAYQALGDYKAAIEDILAAVDLGESAPIAFNNLCWYYGLTEQPELALPYCEQAVEAQPDPAYIDSRGLVYVLLEEYEAAISDFQIVVDALEGVSDPELQAIRAERMAWLELLVAGENPITADVLAKLRGEIVEEEEVDTSPAEVSQPQPTSPPAQPAGEDSWRGLPIMSGASSRFETGNGGLGFVIGVSPADVRAWYDQRLPTLGWQMIQSELAPDNSIAMLQYTKDSQIAVVLAMINEGVTLVTLVVQ